MANWAFRVHNWQQDAANNIGITALRHDQEDNNIYLMLNRAWDTQASNGPQQDMDMNNQKFINCQAATNQNEFALLSQVQSSSTTYGVATGTGNAFIVALSPAPAAYVAGMVVTFKSNQSITGASTINVNGLGVKNIQKFPSVATVAGDILNNQVVMLVYDGTNFQIDSSLGGTLTQNGQSIVATATGGVNAYAITLTPAPSTYVVGQMINFFANTSNTGACTLNVNGLGPIDISKDLGLALQVGDIIIGQAVQVIYDGSNFQLLSPPNGLVNQYSQSIFAIASGSVNAYAITLTPFPSTYVVGQVINFFANTSNTGACTLNVNGLGPKDITKNVADPLQVGDIIIGQMVQLIYDGGDFQLLSIPSGLVNQYSRSIFAITSGSVNAYAITLTPAPSAYAVGQVINFLAATSNTGACTLNVNGLGAKNIVKNVLDPLQSGDINLGQTVQVIYNGSNFQVLSALSN